ncbi:MAG: hypothetical protein ACRDQ6_23830, partial [Pseudonocardiaceae bacterium]
KGILDAIRETKQFSEDTEQQVVDAVTAFKKQFTTEDGSSLGKEDEAEPMDADDVERESVKVAKQDPKNRDPKNRDPKNQDSKNQDSKSQDPKNNAKK